jgi:peptidoglycan/LPS O-acetylase OafA/YrhL
LFAHAPALDGLRGVAILLVLLHHFTIVEPQTEVGRAIAQVAYFGWSGVDLFFVLSGFLITGILVDARGSRRYFSSFYARRTLRIFPLYYLIVFLSLVVLPLFPRLYDLLAGRGAPREQLAYWLYLTNFAIAEREVFTHGILDVAWSLAIEEQFYLVWAVVVWLCPLRALAPLCAGLVLAITAARGWALDRGAAPIDAYVLPHLRADGLAFGALVACAWRLGWLEGQGYAALVIAAVAALGTAWISWIDGEGWWWGPTIQRAGYSLLALAGAASVAAAVTLAPTHWWPRLLSIEWLRTFGKYSYCLYLIHLPVIRLLRAYVFDPEEYTSLDTAWAAQSLFYVIATVSSLGVAWVSWRAFEAPILRLKTRFPY